MRWSIALAATVLLAVVGEPAQADVFHMQAGLTSLETVLVGNPNNAPDTRYAAPGYGAVNYTYQIGRFEVTAGQYAEFLNAVAYTDTYGLYNESQVPTGTNLTSGSANFNNVVGGLTNVGASSVKPSTSAYGTYDQGGNVWEWNQTVVAGSNRLLRGSDWHDNSANMEPWARNVTSGPTTENQWVGFRVASAVPEPSTAALLGIGAAAAGVVAYGCRSHPKCECSGRRPACSGPAYGWRRRVCR